MVSIQHMEQDKRKFWLVQLLICIKIIIKMEVLVVPNQYSLLLLIPRTNKA